MGAFKANWVARRAVALHTTKRIDKAFELYAKAYDLGCTDIYALAAYGVLLMRRGDPQKAVEVLKFATKQPRLKPEQWSYLYQNLGLAYWLSGNLDRAIKVYGRLYERVTTSTVRGSYGFLLIAKGDETGDYNEAVKFNQDALEYDDEDPVIVDNMAQLCYRLGDKERAEKLFRRALSFRPEQFDSLYYLARICLEKENADEARQLLTTALKANYSAFNTVKREQAVSLALSLGLTDPQAEEDAKSED